MSMTHIFKQLYCAYSQPPDAYVQLGTHDVNRHQNLYMLKTELFIPSLY